MYFLLNIRYTKVNFVAVAKSFLVNITSLAWQWLSWPPNIRHLTHQLYWYPVGVPMFNRGTIPTVSERSCIAPSQGLKFPKSAPDIVSMLRVAGLLQLDLEVVIFVEQVFLVFSPVSVHFSDLFVRFFTFCSYTFLARFAYIIVRSKPYYMSLYIVNCSLVLHVRFFCFIG